MQFHEIPDLEWEFVERIVDAVNPPEGNDGGVVVGVRDGRRRWTCFTDWLAVAVDGGLVETDADIVTCPPAPHEPIVIPSRLVSMGSIYARTDGTGMLSVDEHAGTVSVCGVDGGTVVDLPTRRAELAEIPDVLGPSARLPMVNLTRLVHHTLLPPTGVDTGRLPEVKPTLFIEDGVVGSCSPWDLIGARRSTVREAATTAGHGSAVPNMFALLHLSGCFDPTESGVVTLPSDAGRPVVVTGSGWRASVRCFDFSVEIWRPVLVEALESLDCSPHTEADGTILFGWGSATLRASLIDGRVPRTRISRSLTDNVDGTPDLFSELNELSSGLAGARVWWRDGTIHAGIDLPCDELGDLPRTVSDLLEQSDQLGRLLASVAAGTRP